MSLHPTLQRSVSHQGMVWKVFSSLGKKSFSALLANKQSVHSTTIGYQNHSWWQEILFEKLETGLAKHENHSLNTTLPSSWLLVSDQGLSGDCETSWHWSNFSDTFLSIPSASFSLTISTGNLRYSVHGSCASFSSSLGWDWVPWEVLTLLQPLWGWVCYLHVHCWCIPWCCSSPFLLLLPVLVWSSILWVV